MGVMEGRDRAGVLAPVIVEIGIIWGIRGLPGHGLGDTARADDVGACVGAGSVAGRSMAGRGRGVRVGVWRQGIVGRRAAATTAVAQERSVLTAAFLGGAQAVAVEAAGLFHVSTEWRSPLMERAPQ